MRPSARTNKLPGPLCGTAGLLLACAMIARSAVGFAAVPVASVSITVVGPDRKPIPGMVVTVHGVAEGSAAKPVAPVKAIVDQVNRAFEPDLLVIPVGSTIEFPNSDSVSHQIYSFSPAKRFQLPLYRGTPYPPVHFDQAGVVTIGCNIHDEMLAYVMVTDAQYFGRTNAKGTWTTEIPKGKYRISVWHPRMNDDASELDRELTVGDDDLQWTLRLAKSLRPAPLGPHPHSWDAY